MDCSKDISKQEKPRQNKFLARGASPPKSDNGLAASRKEISSLSPIPAFNNNPSKVSLSSSKETSHIKLATKNQDQNSKEEWLIHRNKPKLTEDDIAILGQSINYKKLLYIDLSNNKIEKFPMGVMKYTKQLKHISIANNKISALPNDFLIWFPQMEFLDISGNKMTMIQTGVFSGSPNALETLNISENLLKSLPASIELLKSLSFLQLNGNDLVDIPVTLRCLKNLKALDLSWMNFLGIQKASNRFDRSSPVSLMCLFDFLESLSKSGKEFCHFFEFFDKFSLTREKPDLVKRDFFGRNLLHQAVFQGDTGICRAIGSLYPNLLSERDNEGNNALAFALKTKKSKFLPLFIELGVNLNCSPGRFGSLLHIATMNLDKKSCGILISSGASADLTDSQGNTPLHILFQNYNRNRLKSQAIGRMLLKVSETSLNHKNQEGMTPIQQIVSQNTSTGFIFCLQHNQSSQKENKSVFDFSVVDQNDNTLLHLAAAHPNIQIMVSLIHECPESSLKENVDKKTPYDLIPFDFLTSKKLNHKNERSLALKRKCETKKAKGKNSFLYMKGGYKLASRASLVPSKANTMKEKVNEKPFLRMASSQSHDFEDNMINEHNKEDFRKFMAIDPAKEKTMKESFSAAQAGIERVSKGRDQISKHILKEIQNEELSAVQSAMMSTWLVQMMHHFFVKHFYLNKINFELMKYSVPLADFSDELFTFLVSEKILERDLSLNDFICNSFGDKNSQFLGSSTIFQLWFLSQSLLFGFQNQAPLQTPGTKIIIEEKKQVEFSSMSNNRKDWKPISGAASSSQKRKLVKLGLAEFSFLKTSRAHSIFKFLALNKYISKSGVYSKINKAPILESESCFDFKQAQMREKEVPGPVFCSKNKGASGFLMAQSKNSKNLIDGKSTRISHSYLS